MKSAAMGTGPSLDIQPAFHLRFRLPHERLNNPTAFFAAVFFSRIGYLIVVAACAAGCIDHDSSPFHD
jgi:hypothetical protein